MRKARNLRELVKLDNIYCTAGREDQNMAPRQGPRRFRPPKSSCARLSYFTRILWLNGIQQSQMNKPGVMLSEFGTRFSLEQRIR
jgi:hypothetical protein